MSVTRRTVADDLARTAHALLRGDEFPFILEQIDQATENILEIIHDAEQLKETISKPDSSGG